MSETLDRYDLHTHSAISDGTTSPRQIAELALTIGLAGFALTDHDTIEGWQEARLAAKEFGLEFLPGIELTTNEQGRSIHLLAYGTDEGDSRIVTELQGLRNSRYERAQEMIFLLKQDFDLDWDGVLASSEQGDVQSIGRPHLADALVAAGHFASRSEAFEQALSPSGPYYVPTRTLGTSHAIEMVRSAGGFPVLAHPAAFRMRRAIDPQMIKYLRDRGLGGIELDHPENKDEWLPLLCETAEELGLLVTGASDYHGAGKPNRLGEKTSSKETFEIIRSQVATPA